MITAVSTGQEPNLPIYGFSSEGYPVYLDKVNSHFLWDVPEAHMWIFPQRIFEIVRRRRRRKKKPSTPKTPCRPYFSGPPDDPESDQPLPIYKKALRQLQRESSLKHLARIDADKEQPSIFTKTQSLPIPAPLFDTYQPFYNPSKPPMDYNKFFGLSHLLYKNLELPTTPSTSKKPATKEQSSSDPESQYADISGLLMVQPSAVVDESDDENADQGSSQTEPTPPNPPAPETSSKPSSTQWFTFDDIPHHKWPAKHQEFALTAFNLDIANIALGKFFQLTMFCLDRLCEKKQPLPQPAKSHTSKSSAKMIKNALVQPKRKVISKSTLTDLPRKAKKPYKYLKKKDPSQFRKKKHNRCFICRKRGHFARNCPTKSAKVVRLIQHLQKSSLLSNHEDVESNFSEQTEYDDHIAFILTESTDDSEIDEISVIVTIQGFNHVHSKPTAPSVKILVLPSKFYKPIPVIGFLDTGAQRNILRLYTLSDTAPLYTSITQKLLQFCLENYSKFSHPLPLWKNDKLFIQLPFKLNEDINPTKATHPGMPPSDLLLAKQECDQLLQQGLIEPTNSDWACQAFYVEKMFELVRGKKRLVINYQPLTAFLRDKKFPLPKIQSLFVHLQDAKIFSKFDPKTTFCIPNAHYQ
ncbi:hypothetical protein KPL70_025928 [Citrus sinensis]|nr:hypothetical protein KPL70_025928 [Citrus sinensis]